MFDFKFTLSLRCSTLLPFAVNVVIVVVASAAAAAAVAVAAAAAAFGSITGVIHTATITFSSGERPVDEACRRARGRHERCGSG